MAIAAGTYTLGPGDGDLTLRTGRSGAAAKAGHDLLIRVTAWDATLEIGDGPEGTGIRLDGDGASLRVVEGTGGMKALSEDDKAEIVGRIDEEILRGRPIAFRSTAVRAAPGGGYEGDGELTLVDTTRPITFTLALDDDGAVRARATVTQSAWGITPYSTLFGALKVADDVEVRVEARVPAA